MKILIVEDTEPIRRLLTRWLQMQGFEPITAEDGLRGLERAQQDQPDLIVMDLSLPEMDGWQVTQRLKADPQTASIPVIALTAHAMSGDREKALKAGCDDYESKPIDFDQLLVKIRALSAQAGEKE
jgi:CheY-like chemotaxis protein